MKYSLITVIAAVTAIVHTAPVMLEVPGPAVSLLSGVRRLERSEKPALDVIESGSQYSRKARQMRKKNVRQTQLANVTRKKQATEEWVNRLKSNQIALDHYSKMMPNAPSLGTQGLGDQSPAKNAEDWQKALNQEQSKAATILDQLMTLEDRLKSNRSPLTASDGDLYSMYAYYKDWNVNP